MQPIAAAGLNWRQIYFNSSTIPFWSVHVGAIIGIAVLGWSWTGLALALAMYVPRMFLATGGYHRYFAHRSYRTSRAFQLVLALGAMATGERGVLWWASHHRRHHRLSDRPGDVHSPKEGFWWSHMGWMLSGREEGTDLDSVKDLARFPELRFLERIWIVPPVLAAVITWSLGGAFALVWGFALSQVLYWHGTFTINSFSHVIGTRRFATRDDSRNHWLLALITMGEGWHNNHHHQPGSARQGMRWWEIDVTYYILRSLAAVGLIWDLRARGAGRRPIPDAAPAAA